MLSSKQCELARLMTQDTITDSKINEEFKSLNLEVKLSAVVAIDKLLQLHDMPFDKGFRLLVDDFRHIANEFYISPATLFYIYMENKSQ